MHELSIALSIVDGVLEELERRPGSLVAAVHLRVGRVNAIDRDALAFSYGIACDGTPLAGSRLIVEDGEVVIWCPRCRAERAAVGYPAFGCAQCGSPPERIVRGGEMEITQLELAA